MTQEDAIKLLRTEREVQALDTASYMLFLSLGLALLHQGVYPIATVLPPPIINAKGARV